MGGKGLLLIGAIAGAIFATTPQGQKFIAETRKKAERAWSRPDVQKRVDDIQSQVRKNVPVVGDDIADVIGRTKPAQPSTD